jgi:ubiquitin carboxyl-terminal hydrolase L3
MAEAAPEPEWLPIESNPPLMTSYAAKLGFDTAAAVFHDVLALDEWATDMIPRPCHSVLMLFPIKDASEAHRAEEEAAMAAAEAEGKGPAGAADVYFCQQKVANACGTIGVLHAALNTSVLTGGGLALAPDSWLARFHASSASLSPDERARALGEDAELAVAHSEQVEVGDSDVVDDTYNHFVAFIDKGGQLWELDGRKARPVCHGPVGPDLLLSAVRVARQFMARDPEELRFTLVALAPPVPPEEEDETVGQS